MNKLNNKGFAISTILYGLLVVLMLLITLLMSTMSFNRKNSKDYTDEIRDNLEQKIYEAPTSVPDNPSVSDTTIPTISSKKVNCSSGDFLIELTITDDNKIDLNSIPSDLKMYYADGIGYQPASGVNVGRYYEPSVSENGTKVIVNYHVNIYQGITGWFLWPSNGAFCDIKGNCNGQAQIRNFCLN